MFSANLDFKDLKRIFKVLFFGSVFAIFVVLVLYLSKFNGGFSNSNEAWGTFGDFFGGTLNPILSFISFIALLVTIFIQSKELELTRKELELTRSEMSRSADAQESSSNYFKEQTELLSKQRLDNSLYSLLDVFLELQKKIFETTLNNPDCGQIDLAFRRIVLNIYPSQKINEVEPKIIQAKNLLIDEYKGVVSYFDFLYRFVLFVDKSGGDDAKDFIELIKSMLSEKEIALLAVYCGTTLDKEKDSIYALQTLLVKYKFIYLLSGGNEREQVLFDDINSLRLFKAFD
ncbi:putative phage abortive infection protein [Pseudoalteromonas xiamenensis]